MDRLTLENLIHEKMPLAKAMNVSVVRADDVVELSCSLASNHNHLGTAFGGSLSALMILAAYCQLFQLMNGQGHVLLRRSTLKFMRPVKEDLRAVCLLPTPNKAREFLDAYQRKGKARLTLTSEIVLKDGRVACRMVADFIGRI
jgi:thioesterase domain-containing protein